jgi:glycosyltransferase involved in cell wall biosynthesis
MREPLVSVIIPNYNYAHYLPQALDSVLAQTYSKVEIIVIDDGSTDDSESILRSYGDRIRWIKQQNQGVSASRNLGVRETKGELVAFLDADDIWLPTKLEKQVRRILSEPEIGLIHCGVEQIEPKGGSLGVLLNGLEGWVSTDFLLFQGPVIIAAGSTAVVSRAVFEAVGGFDPRLSTSADWDFSYRVAIHRRVGFVPEALVKYRMHGSNMHGNIKAMEHDMLIGYEKAFRSNSACLPELRRRCYGNLHMVLAGSFFRAGHKTDFARHALKSLWLTPGNMKSLLGYPLRRYRKKDPRL